MASAHKVEKKWSGIVLGFEKEIIQASKQAEDTGYELMIRQVVYMKGLGLWRV